MVITYTNTTAMEGDTIVNTTTLNINDSKRFFQYLDGQELRTDTKYLDMASKAVGSKYRFEIKLQHMGSNNDFIELHYRCNRDVLVKVELIMVLTGSLQKGVSDVKAPVKVPAMTWVFADWFLKSDLENGIRSTGNKGFQLKFKFSITEENPRVADQALSPNDYDTLSQEYPDVIVKSEDGVEYQAHKVYLCRSPIMKAQFDNPTADQNNVVQTNLKSEVLKAVLDFIYSGNTKRLADIPENLLAAADYYQLNTLKNACQEEVRKKLSVETAINYLQLADQHSCAALKKAIFEFIKNGEANLVIKTTGWATLKCEKLLKEMFEYIWSDVRVATIPLERY